MRRLGASFAVGAAIGLGTAAWWYTSRPPVAFEGWPPEDRRPLIVIDAGHGGDDGGTQGSGALEKAAALETALKLSRELQRRGVRTLLTRETDVTLSLSDRIQRANDCEAVAFISVHYNYSTESPDVRGLEVFYSAPKEMDAQRRLAGVLGVDVDSPAVEARSVSLADVLRTHACPAALTPDRGTRNRPDMAVTRRTACASVLVECAYLSNPTDAGRAKSPAWQGDLASGLADGVVKWLESAASKTTLSSPDAPSPATRASPSDSKSQG